MSAIRDVPGKPFDEEENPSVLLSNCYFLPYEGCFVPYDLPAASSIPARSSDHHFPQNPDNDLAGWMYFNFDNYESFYEPSDEVGLQNWVVVSMSVEGRYSVDFDATSLGNGCTPPARMTDQKGNAPAIGPAPNVNPSALPNP